MFEFSICIQGKQITPRVQIAAISDSVVFSKEILRATGQVAIITEIQE